MSLNFVLIEAWNGLRRNVSMVVSVILVTLVSLTFVGSAVLLQLQVQSMKSFWYDKAQVAVYLCTEYSTLGQCDQAEANPGDHTQHHPQTQIPLKHIHVCDQGSSRTRPVCARTSLMYRVSCRRRARSTGSVTRSGVRL